LPDEIYCSRSHKFLQIPPSEQGQSLLLQQEERLSKVKKAPPVATGNALPAARDDNIERRVYNI